MLNKHLLIGSQSRISKAVMIMMSSSFSSSATFLKKETNSNRLMRIVTQINQNTLMPESIRKAMLTMAFNGTIRYAGTTGIGVQEWNEQSAVVHLRNRFHVQNHLNGIHATAMATLAESATGMLFALHVPDETHLPVLKRMTVQFQKRATGNLRAVATLSDEQKESIAATEKGSLIVPVRITDDDGKEPIDCQMEWAWTPRRRK